MNVNLNAQKFEQYNCIPDKIIVCANTLHLFKVISTMSNDDILSMYIAFMPDVYKRDYLQYVFSNNNKPNANNEVNIQVTQKLMYYIKEYFHLSSINTKTRKTKTRLGRFTRKR